MFEHGSRKYRGANLARDIGLSVATVNDWLNAAEVPGKLSIPLLARQFGTTSRYIYELIDKEPPPDLNDTLERVNAIIYRISHSEQEKLLKELEAKHGKK